MILKLTTHPTGTGATMWALWCSYVGGIGERIAWGIDTEHWFEAAGEPECAVCQGEPVREAV